MDGATQPTNIQASSVTQSPNISQTPQPPSFQSPVPSSPIVPTPKNPSNMGLWGTLIVVILIILGVGAYAMMSKPAMPKTNIMEEIPTPTTSLQELTPAAVPSIEAQAGSLSEGNNNENLDEDAANLNAELEGANTQLNMVDQGLNDKPGDLSE